MAEEIRATLTKWSQIEYHFLRINFGGEPDTEEEKCESEDEDKDEEDDSDEDSEMWDDEDEMLDDDGFPIF